MVRPAASIDLIAVMLILAIITALAIPVLTRTKVSSGYKDTTSVHWRRQDRVLNWRLLAGSDGKPAYNGKGAQ